MNKWYRYTVLVAAMLLLCTGCYAHYVTNGVLRDTLFSVEVTQNGNWRIWLTHDDVAGYCTNDAGLGRNALSLLEEHDGEVIVEFKDIKLGDEAYSWWDSSDCGTVYSGGGTAHMFMLLSITPVPSR